MPILATFVVGTCTDMIALLEQREKVRVRARKAQIIPSKFSSRRTAPAYKDATIRILQIHIVNRYISPLSGHRVSLH